MTLANVNTAFRKKKKVANLVTEDEPIHRVQSRRTHFSRSYAVTCLFVHLGSPYFPSLDHGHFLCSSHCGKGEVLGKGQLWASRSCRRPGQIPRIINANNYGIAI